ncbi:MAG: threonine aldolase family protein, partial [Planctomycetota bacterium]|nr:threonine aldolase family protein [Planctomycetota bacterium]
MIDLRSDTITKPTDEMREVMAKASVGDDVLGEDPTVNELESLTAEVLGTEAAVYMPSGTMTNQIAIRTHTKPGDEIFLHEHSHIYLYEAGGPAALSGVTCNLLKGDRGVFSAETLVRAIRKNDIHLPRPRLLCVENTHNRGGGSIWPVETLVSVSEVARNKGLKVHLDGARLWNAAVAMGVSEKQLVSEYFDSVSICFSKGLGAPVGSALAGKADFIERARHFRKM